MNLSFNIIKDLIAFIEIYTKDNGKEPKDIKEFIFWLNEIMFDQTHHQENEGREENLNIELTYLMIVQHKYYKAYVKKILTDSEITTAEDYSFLYHLSFTESYRKMELIHLHLLEAPSGIEIIKRLLKKGFIEEFDDDMDKRAKRVKITAEGRRELEKLNPGMQIVYTHMAADMSLNEKLHLVSFLRRISEYHQTKMHSNSKGD